jgi:hypothetical protein
LIYNWSHLELGAEMPASTIRPAVRLAALLLAPLFFLAAPVAGQQADLESADRTAVTAVAPVSSSIVPGPTAAGAAFTFQPGQAETLRPQPASALDDAVPAPPHSRNMAMMIVGGAVMVAGAVIGGDAGTIVMIGGGVVGIIGLWRYLQ